jgi:hypothetical protein
MNPADPFTGGQGLGALPVRFRRRGVRSPKLQAFFQRIRDWWDRARAQGRIRGRRGARFAARGFGTVDDLEEGI